MSQDKNHKSHGQANVVDLDLVEMDLTAVAHIPWLSTLLREIQYLRDNAEYGQKEEVQHYKDILDKLEIEYDGY